MQKLAGCSECCSIYKREDSGLTFFRHLTGMKSLLSVVGPSPNTSHITTPITVGRRASFWNFARADYQAAFLNRTPTLLDTEDLSMWQNCGIQVSPAGTLYANPSFSGATCVFLNGSKYLHNYFPFLIDFETPAGRGKR